MKEEHFKARDHLIMAILSDHCLARFDYKKRPCLLTDFSKNGFGYNLCQPADDDASMAVMWREMSSVATRPQLLLTPRLEEGYYCVI